MAFAAYKGARVKRKEDPRLLTGAAQCTADRGLPGTLLGIGEAATIGSTPAIVNAVIDTLRPLGVTALDMPLRPERIWRAIQGQASA